MGVRNYVIEGVSCSGKTSVCDELNQRGYHAIHGDRELAYWGDPETGTPVDSANHENWIWDAERVRALVEDQSHPMTFLCGGSRNLDQFIPLLDGVFVLDVDLDTLNARLAVRPDDEWGCSPTEGASAARRELVAARSVPGSVVEIDATVPLSQVVDAILTNCLAGEPGDA